MTAVEAFTWAVNDRYAKGSKTYQDVGPNTLCITVVAENVDTVDNACYGSKDTGRKDTREEGAPRRRELDAPEQTDGHKNKDEVGSKVRCMCILRHVERKQLGMEDVLASSRPATEGPKTH